MSQNLHSNNMYPNTFVVFLISKIMVNIFSSTAIHESSAFQMFIFYVICSYLHFLFSEER